MVSRVGSLTFLPDRLVASHAPGRAELAQMLAGKARVLTEGATGVPAGADQRAVDTLKNPQNKIGHDHSGPPHGPAFRQKISSRSYTKVSSTVQAPAPRTTSLLVSGVTAAFVERPWLLWARPHDKLLVGVAPWSRGYLTVRCFRTVGTGPFNSTDLEVKLWNITKRQTADDARVTTLVLAAGIGGTNESDRDADLYVDLDPGLNAIGVSLFSQTVGHEVTITALELEQRAKLSH